MIKIIKKIFNIKEKAPEMPDEYFIIDYSVPALRENILDDQNKVIYRIYYDRYGNRKTEKVPYSEGRIQAFMEVYKIPGYDKTNMDQEFPIHSKILPSEVSYNLG